mmetsp:Transcript_96/g.188  ORF Transcript_96/g.188 Transcript_96/m.188 type:complete len:106 (+) Transcript_96:692-1009(+)
MEGELEDEGEEGEEESLQEEASGLKTDKEQDIEALRELLMKEHLQRLEAEKLKAKESPGTISKKQKNKLLWRKGKKKPRKQKWDLSPSNPSKKSTKFKFSYAKKK